MCSHAEKTSTCFVTTIGLKSSRAAFGLPETSFFCAVVSGKERLITPHTVGTSGCGVLVPKQILYTALPRLSEQQMRGQRRYKSLRLGEQCLLDTARPPYS